ncbi:hypothetical protein [Marinimicrobium koreense]|uniref:hypothetical protein n=1 Tax=Marinimicrobium koreense TaxID=306545 RepID=UPI003F71F85B
MIFFVFSYNRGPHLKNCVESIECCAPGQPVIVFDDASDDPETIAVLASIGERHEVVVREDKDSTDQHGALYTNMQNAIDRVCDDDVICFLQDDTQMVRRLDDDDVVFIKEYFDRYPDSGFLAPVFQRKIARPATLQRFVYDPERGVYIQSVKNGRRVAGVYYSDISITTTRRLKDKGWRFLMGEFENEQQAARLFEEMGYLYAPFVMWLPNPPAYRNKKKSLAFSIAEKINRAGLYPFSIMTDARVRALKSRPTKELPIAEHYLSTTVDGVPRPWIFHPLRRSRLLRRLDKLEAVVRSAKSWFTPKG